MAQINTGRDVAGNLAKVRQYAENAARQGAELVVFPEATMSAFGTNLFAACTEYGTYWREQLTELAREIGIVIIVGEFEEADAGRVRNLLGVYFPDGTRQEYVKIHLYDAFGYRESDSVDAGDKPVVVALNGTRIGLALCYDIRFPKLFAELSRAGAETIILSASWGAGPGKVEQWEVLARARALDSNTNLVAVGQADPKVSGVDAVVGAPTGVGHSMVSNPFGHTIVELDGAERLEVVELDQASVEKARTDIPVLVNAKLGY
jgi:predicted amidohydrolase